MGAALLATALAQSPPGPGPGTEDLRPWANAGIGPAEAARWRAAGIEFAEWAKQWKSERFTATEAAPWVRARVNVYTAADFRDAGFSIAEAAAWIDNGVRSALRAEEFRTRGFTPAEAGEWWRLEFFPEDADEWRKAGLGAAEAAEWEHGEKEYSYSGRSKDWSRIHYSVEWAAPWKAAGFTIAEARRARDYDVGLDAARSWRQAGFGFDEAVAWSDAGFPPDQAAPLKAAGLDPVEADERRSGSFDGDIISSFHSDVFLHTNATLSIVETITFSNAAGGSIERCLPRSFPAYVTLRRSQWSSDEGFPTYTFRPLLHNGGGAIERVERDRFGTLTRCLGGAEPILAPGLHTFELRYTTNERVMQLHDQDRLFLEILGADMTVPVRQASATVHLPPGADTVRIDGYAGPPNRKYFKTALAETADGDVVTYSTTRSLRPGGTFAVAVNLRKGIVRPPFWHTARHVDREFHRVPSSLATFTGGLGLTGLYFIVAWRRVGRDPAPGVVLPLYEPPRGMSPALARYLWTRRRADATSVAATLVHVAERGGLRIREREGRYRVELTGTAPQGCQSHERDFITTLFGGVQNVTLRTADARSRLWHSRHLLRRRLRDETRPFVATNRRYVWPGLVLSIAAVAGAILVGPKPDISPWLYLALLAAVMAVLNLAFARLLKAPTASARETLDALAGFRGFLQASFSAATSARELPAAVAAHLSYAIALNVDVERIAVLDRQRAWYAGDSGGFSVTDFAREVGR